ncbi:MAG: hypothetical protein PVH88_12945 [Ignavibacteria bacterium]
MPLLNCWEFKKCGREKGGKNVKKFGICPAAIEVRANNINNGINGGRTCWLISGTFCDGKVQGAYASKLIDCMDCDFYKEVSGKANLLSSNEILKILKSK